MSIYIKNWKKKFAVFIFIYVLIVILAGGIVRTTQSGMGCPDWPTCFGQWIPPTSVSELPANYESYLRKQDIDHTFNVYHTWIEAINRYIAALLGVFAVLQCILFYKVKKTYRKVFTTSLLFLALVIITGLFGAIVVRLNLAHLSISVHLLLALLLLITQLYLLVNAYAIQPIAITIKSKKILYLTALIITIQFVLGTIVRMHVDDVSKALQYTNRQLWLVNMPLVFVIHRSFSWLVMGSIMYCYFYFKQTPFKKYTLVLLLLAVANVTLGVIMYYNNIPALAQPLHLLLGTMAMAYMVYLLLITKTQKVATI